MKHPLFLIISLTILFSACAHKSNYWSSPKAWCKVNGVGDAVSSSQVDVFYIVSTNVFDEDVLVASLSPDVRLAYARETHYIAMRLDHKCNVFAPCYHQLAMHAFALPEDSLSLLYDKVCEEVCEAFDYYIANLNEGRPFVVMGFSQGAMLTLDVVKHMSPEAAKKMLAAYMLGYRLSEDDLQHPNVHPALDATQSGVVASFNTVANVDATWPMLSDDAVTCINPVNWTTDTTTATLIYEGDTSALYVDTLHHVLLAPDMPAEKYYNHVISPFCALGCLHMGDLFFYLDNIRDNIFTRLHNKQ